MNAKTIISINGHGLSRAQRNQDGEWIAEKLLEGQDLRSLVHDPSNSSLVYAGKQEGGILRSTDGGRQWEQIGLETVSVKSISVSKSEPGTIFAGTKKPPSIYISRDHGENWSEIDGFRDARRWYWMSPAESGLSPYVQAIALSPVDPEVIVVGIEAGAVLRSDDGGITWTQHIKGAIRDCHTMAFHHSDGNWIYEAGGSGGGAAFSQDGGKRWRQPKNNLDRKYGWACAADPVDPETWYVSSSPPFSFPQMAPAAHIDGKANGSVYRKRGESPWERLGGGLPDPLNYMAYALCIDPSASGHLYAGLSNGDVWHTADYGDNWQQLPVNLGGIHREMVVLFS
jgi:photosystem II stability/assembly factor-like uncharacterized protein